MIFPEYSCCDPSLRTKYVCFDIDLTGDEFYGNFSEPRNCMDFSRSFTHCGSTTKWLEQINAATAFLDASMVKSPKKVATYSHCTTGSQMSYHAGIKALILFNVTHEGEKREGEFRNAYIFSFFYWMKKRVCSWVVLFHNGHSGDFFICNPMVLK